MLWRAEQHGRRALRRAGFTSRVFSMVSRAVSRPTAIAMAFSGFPQGSTATASAAGARFAARSGRCRGRCLIDTGMGAGAQVGGQAFDGPGDMFVEQHPDPGGQPEDREHRDQPRDDEGVQTPPPRQAGGVGQRQPGQGQHGPAEGQQGEEQERCADAGTIGSASVWGLLLPRSWVASAGGPARHPRGPGLLRQLPAASRPQTVAMTGNSGFSGRHVTAIGAPSVGEPCVGVQIGPARAVAIDQRRADDLRLPAFLQAQLHRQDARAFRPVSIGFGGE